MEKQKNKALAGLDKTKSFKQKKKIQKQSSMVEHLGKFGQEEQKEEVKEEKLDNAFSSFGKSEVCKEGKSALNLAFKSKDQKLSYGLSLL